MSFRYAIFDTAWGQAALAWTDAGICDVTLPGVSAGELKRLMKRRRPAAVLGAEREVGAVVEMIRSYFAGEPVEFSTELDLAGSTPFQREVYAALATVPYGETWSYGELAAAVGRPGASRAIGSANARNPVPLIVPCHRVIRSDGALGGFSAPGGVGLKGRMLELERAGCIKAAAATLNKSS